MPDNKNESKLMAMLERRGIVRKAGAEDDQPEPDPGVAPSRPDTDLRSMFGSPASGATKVTPAARQPVPGISNPVLPGARPQSAEREQSQQRESRTSDFSWMDQSQSSESPEAEPQQIPASYESEQPPPAPNAARLSPASAYAGSADSDSFPLEHAAMTADPGAAGIPHRPQAEDYTDRYLEIDALYEVLALKSKRTDTIYLVEEYLKSLPDSLPDESRREIVGKIVAASGFDFDLLMGDGVLRVKMLKEYAERFAHHTDEYIAARQSELDNLDQQILRVRKLVENRRELHKKQFFAIEAEAQRLKDILSFITG